MDFGASMDLSPVVARHNLTFSSSVRLEMTRMHEFYIVYGGGILVLAIFLVMLIIGHLSCWNKPKEQKTVLVIILMPSIHFIASYVGLHATNRGDTFFMVLDSIKECYAGLVIGMFLRLLYTYLNINLEELSRIDALKITKGKIICNFFPITLIQPRHVRLTLNRLKFVKYFTWQFLVVRLACSVLMIVLKLLEIYPIWLNWAFFAILSSSVSLAFYTLFVFYKAYYKRLPSYTRPQFFCFKGIFFVCFWQGGVLRILGATGIVKSNYFWRQELQNDLIMWEMMLFTIFHMVAYSPTIYADHAPILPIQQPASKPELAKYWNWK